MRKYITLLFFCLSFVITDAQNLVFSDSTIVSLVTCSPGKAAYEKFGHTAIRLNDPKNKIDLVFNYGIFSFETSNFYYKFVKGDTDYQLGVYPTEYFLPQYKERNSNVWESEILMTTAEKRNLINTLLENYRPENREYRYNFVYDNCATRPRDKILAAIEGHLILRNDVELKTYRQWFNSYAGNGSWLNFGLDLVFGMKADKDCPQYESMFLPEVLMNEFKAAKILQSNNRVERPLVSQERILVTATDEVREKNHWYSSPTKFFIVLAAFIFLFTVFEFSKNRHYKILDSVILTVTGLAGTILLFLMVFSSHPLVEKNLNILWLNPLNIFAAYLIWIRKARLILFYYQIANIFLLGLTLIAFTLSFQDFNVAIFPFIVLLLIRYSTWVVIIKHKLFKKNKYTSRKL